MSKPLPPLLAAYGNYKNRQTEDILRCAKVTLNSLAASINYKVNAIMDIALKEGPKSDVQNYEALEEIIQQSKQDNLFQNKKIKL